MKKILAFLFIAVLFAASCEGAVPQDDIIILYTNDVHCGIDDVIGYAGVSAYRQEMPETGQAAAQ